MADFSDPQEPVEIPHTRKHDDQDSPYHDEDLNIINDEEGPRLFQMPAAIKRKHLRHRLPPRRSYED